MKNKELMFFRNDNEGCDIVAFQRDCITIKYNCYNLYELVENSDYDEDDTESDEEEFILQESEEEDYLSEEEIHDRGLVNEDGTDLTDKDLEQCQCKYEVNINGHEWCFEDNDFIENDEIEETEYGFEIEDEKYVDVANETSLAIYELVSDKDKLFAKLIEEKREEILDMIEKIERDRCKGEFDLYSGMFRYVYIDIDGDVWDTTTMQLNQVLSGEYGEDRTCIRVGTIEGSEDAWRDNEKLGDITDYDIKDMEEFKKYILEENFDTEDLESYEQSEIEQTIKDNLTWDEYEEFNPDGYETIWDDEEDTILDNEMEYFRNEKDNELDDLIKELSK